MTWLMAMSSSYSLIATLPPSFDEAFRSKLVESILNDKVGENKLSTKESGSNVGLNETTESCTKKCGVPLISYDSIRLSPAPLTSFDSSLARLVAIFCPSSLTDTACEQARHQLHSTRVVADENNFQHAVVEWFDDSSKLSDILLSLIHPFVSQNFTIRAILTHQNVSQHPKLLEKLDSSSGDIVILNLSHCPHAAIVEELLDATNCEVIRSGPEAILKVLLLSKLEFFSSALPPCIDSNKSQARTIEIPTCAVCLFRIDPSRLGLPRPPKHCLCSKFCPPPPAILNGSSFSFSCPRQRLLLPWPPPNHCEACHTIRNYWLKHCDEATTYRERDEVFCCLCGMRETLWVCLTCAFVGCGRYSNKHAAEHNDTTYHPFCMELSTLRIWSYVDSEFVHRIDLLECPASLQNLHQLHSIVHGTGSYTATAQGSLLSSISFSDNVTAQERVSDGIGSDLNNRFISSASTSHTPDIAFSSRNDRYHYERMVASSVASVDEKTPKKAIMIGEEYEVLLQSALEDQDQFYEGEITWLRATLSAQLVDRKSLLPVEATEIQSLGIQNCSFRKDIERAGRELLAAQALEAGYRSTSHRLLQGQSIAQDLLKKINEESTLERQQGRILIEDLELQIADLKVNQRMMEQFLQNEDLKNSQIVGTEQQLSPSAKGTRSKKGKRMSKSSRY